MVPQAEEPEAEWQELWPKIEVLDCTARDELRDAILALLRNTLVGVSEAEFTKDHKYVNVIKLKLDTAAHGHKHHRQERFDRRGNWHVFIASAYSYSAATDLRLRLYDNVHLVIFYA